MIILFTHLLEACGELQTHLEELRKELDDEQFDKIFDGPLGEVFSAAMDVEYCIEKLNAS